jgi:hypothetical protein
MAQPLFPPPYRFRAGKFLTPLACERVQSDDLYETGFLLLLSSRVSLQLCRMRRGFRRALFSVYGSVMVVMEGWTAFTSRGLEGCEREAARLFSAETARMEEWRWMMSLAASNEKTSRRYLTCLVTNAALCCDMVMCISCKSSQHALTQQLLSQFSA